MPYIEVLMKYATFDGRASRMEFWLFFVINLIISAVLFFIHEIAVVIYSLAVLVPYLAVGARRLHDHNKSGWLQLIVLVPLIGWIIVLILMALPGTDGENKHGPKPS